MTYVFFNPLSNNKNGSVAESEITKILNSEKLQFTDITTISDIATTISKINKTDKIIIAGGDGTLTRFADDVYNLKLTQEVFYYPSGSGNDFYNDIKDSYNAENKLIPLNKYIESLPEVTVNGITRHFINGIGFGIDGYCCEEGDKLREASDKPVNYTSIAVTGVLLKYKPCNAKITVDGQTRYYKKVWLAPTMLGRFYGGAMKIAPKQNRLNNEKTLTNVVLHKSCRLSTLMNFPKIIAGLHESLTRIVDFRIGHNITVEFEKPQALQIDGETIKNVTSYSTKY